MSSVNNKRILKNTLFLYFRMIVVMAVNLYTVRVVLHQLGVVDYGIYNVVGGVVSMFSFINSTLTTSSQRYFSIELAKGDEVKLNQWFCLNITTFSIFILAFLIISETIGLWFVNTQMVIPEERLFAVNVVYQLSICTFCIHFFSIPYHALIIAHEKMSAFAYISIVEVLLKLCIALLLVVILWDKLIVYGILMFLVSCGITGAYIVYNIRHFRESKYHLYWNRKEMKDLLSFSGWHFFGTFSTVIRSQGINILLNMFFNPAINAARAIAFQIYHAVSQLSANFIVAVKPQIYKSYTKGNYDELYRLIIRSSTICSFLVSVLIFPILIDTNFVLGLWLKNVPDYAVVFTQLVLINGLIDAVNGPLAAAALATGKIKNYELLVATAILMNLPFSYIALKLGAEPTATMIVSIVISVFVTYARAYMAYKMVGMPLSKCTKMFFKLIFASLLTCGIMYVTVYDAKDMSILKFILYAIFAVMVLFATYLVFVFDRKDVKYACQFINKKIKK